ncbi:MAG: sulfatase-like hydrolase/transferase [Desulfobacula sp.]|uniref:sulfatase-like hydrolase/transferase n=1 Tax=Desulfobacula sp. TaxID=2593537 RepID=UPI0025B85BA7|nr:sulfatase-like hydrolase/transferase [Desulfobacula sp.]MCD4722736.1 sulfatase-like hydrolase/transferase [Desulfobacula sp.]
MLKTITSSNKKYYLIPLVFFLTVFFIIPYELYYNAREYWEWKKQIPLQLNVVGIFAYAILLICIRILFIFFNERVAKIVASLFLFAGIFILVADVFAPLQTNLATGEKLVSTEPLFYTIIETVFFAAFLLFFIKQSIESSARKGIYALLVVGLITFAYFGLVIFSVKPEIILQKTQKASSTITGNVYHILLDEMQTDAAQIYLDENNNSVKYDGFVLYPNTLANYLSTHASFPSYITGSFFKGGSFETWYKSVYKDKGLFKALYEKGYQIRQYAYSNNWRVPFIEEFHTLNDIYEQVTQIQNREYQDFIQILIARSVPNLFANEALAIGKKIGSRVYNQLLSDSKEKTSAIPIAYEDGKEPFSSVLAFKHMIRTEKQRPANGQYIYFHSVLPHPPYVYDGNGHYSLEYRDTGTKGYYGQVRYAFKLVEELIAELKRLGRYNNSTIIVHADTGHSKEGFFFKENNVVHGTLEKIKANSDLPRMGDFFKSPEDIPEEFYNYLKDHILSRTHALLMIKPAQSIGKLKISTLETQLIDLYPSLSDLLALPGIDFERVEGISVYSKVFPEKRDASFFWFPSKEIEPDIIKLNISNYKDLKNALVSFGGKINEKKVIAFPKDGVSEKVGSENEGRLKLVNFSHKGKMGKDNNYRWAVGKHGQIIFTGLRLDQDSMMEFGFSLKPFLVNENTEMIVSTSLSSAGVFLKPGLKKYQISLKFPADKDPVIGIAYADAQSPKSLGMGSDVRDLSALWTKISLHFPGTIKENQNTVKPEKLFLKDGIFYDLGSFDEKGILLQGFGGKDSNSKGTWRWAVGRENKMVLQGLIVKKDTRISMEFKLMPSIINEQKEMILKTDISEVKVLLKPGLNSYNAILTLPKGHDPKIQIIHSDAKSPLELGTGTDIRQLASLWTEMTIVPVGFEDKL